MCSANKKARGRRFVPNCRQVGVAAAIRRHFEELLKEETAALATAGFE